MMETQYKHGDIFSRCKFAKNYHRNS